MLPRPGFDSLNIEYVFRALYDAVMHTHAPGNTAQLLTMLWQIIAVVGYLISLAALIVVIYSIMQLFDIRRREVAIYGPLPALSTDERQENPRWLHVQDLLASASVNDWRQAIIESDIMLGEALTQRGYPGETVGEQLKQADPANITSLDDAWEAHKVRNHIAHAGSSFKLSETLAVRTVARYENVFRELEFI